MKEHRKNAGEINVHASKKQKSAKMGSELSNNNMKTLKIPRKKEIDSKTIDLPKVWDNE